MRRNAFIPGVMAATMLVAGCAHRVPPPAVAPVAPPSSPAPVILPAEPEPGRVTQINAKYQYVVVDFGRCRVPPPGSRLVAYRRDQPVATLRLTESARGHFVVADILDGDPRIGDEIRAP